jgi:outer membrane lipoprotein-sorting protein
MKRVLTVAVVVLAAVALYAATAPAGQQAVTPKQFSALQKRVTTLEKTNKQIIQALGIIVACAFDKGAIPTTKTPQYHVTVTGETTDFYVLTTNDPDCVTLINSPLMRQLLTHVQR